MPSVRRTGGWDGECRDAYHASDDRLWEFLSLASEYSPSELDALEHARDEDRERWNAARAAYADRLAELASYW